MESKKGLYKGFVLSESLSNPLVLNTFEKINVKVEKHNDINYPEFWHLFMLRISEDEIQKAVELVCEYLKNGWYAHFWNEEILFICLPNHLFKIERHIDSFEKEFDKVKDFAETFGIKRQYLDFIIED
ncbi:hypothetical protein [Lacrimispora sp.]|uniref:hypothetical protein n=1 Tax=Lacrimispora sp. TaxID=2719234 RepID=UPI0028A99EDA|nr:hypothetical protein [Lacrimispora sp.]